MATTEGYGLDFTAFDKITAPLLEKANEKFGKHSYQNWCPFRSPKGTLMAFHMKSYSDIRVVNLDTMEIVLDGEFYAHVHHDDEGKPDYRHPNTVYASHTNCSIWVPAYIDSTYTNHKGEEAPITYNIDDWDGDEKIEDIKSVPLAFNAWTIWAADYEFYVDVLDLSKIDDGIVTKLDLGEANRGMYIPISASHVRNFVKGSAEHWFRLANKEKGTPGESVKEVTFDAQILAEKHIGRLNIGGDRGFHDIYAEKGVSYLSADPPWKATRARWIESGYYKGDEIPA